MLTPLLIAVGIGYLLGSLPFGYLVARAKGVNIFEAGSKNPGATNVRRVLGAGPGNLVFLLDALKGAAATAWPLLHLDWTRQGGRLTPAHFSFAPGESTATEMAVAGLVGALLGHSFSFFTRFRGGKGVATATGGLLVLMPLVLLVGVAIWMLTFYVTRYVSLASILASVALPLAAWGRHERRLLLGLALLVTAIVIVRHRTNIQRLLDGTEAKFAKKSRPQS